MLLGGFVDGAELLDEFLALNLLRLVARPDDIERVRPRIEIVGRVTHARRQAELVVEQFDLVLKEAVGTLRRSVGEIEPAGIGHRDDAGGQIGQGVAPLVVGVCEAHICAVGQLVRGSERLERRIHLNVAFRELFLVVQQEVEPVILAVRKPAGSRAGEIPLLRRVRYLPFDLVKPAEIRACSDAQASGARGSAPGRGCS